MRQASANHKATHRQLRRHNQQLILRAVYNGLADNRAALAQETGLTKPTVSDLVSELIDEGLLVEEGRGKSTGGKRPRLLKFVPEARHTIGIAVNSDHILGALANLEGHIIARHRVDLDNTRGEEAVQRLLNVINGLVAQLDASLLCIGVGVAGVVESATGTISYAPHLGWRNFPLAERLERIYDVPAYVANSTELASMAHFVFGMPDEPVSLATVLISSGVGVGLVINGITYPGGGEIGHLRIAQSSHVNAPPDLQGRLETFLGWPYVKKRAAMLRDQYSSGLLPGPGERLTYMHIRYAATNNDPAALALRDELSHSLAQVFAWVIGLLRPEHVALAGPITDLGEPLIEHTVAYTRDLLVPDLVDRVTFSLAQSDHLVVIGAIAQSLQLDLGLV